MVVPKVSVLVPRRIVDPALPERSVIVLPPFAVEISKVPTAKLRGALLIEPGPES